MTTPTVMTTTGIPSNLLGEIHLTGSVPGLYASSITDNRPVLPYEYHIGTNGAQGTMLGAAPAIMRLRGHIDKVCTSRLNPSVIITGETGTGKELVAKAVHYNGPRKELPFIGVNVGALNPGIIDSSLFGHVRGAFTNAFGNYEGVFENVGYGTLFLDEIAELPLALQVKLLRVLEERTFEKVGSSKSIKFNGTVIVATNKNLEELVEQKRFRADLFHRLERVPLSVPPLRERREDIGLLAAHFIQQYNRQEGTAYNPELGADDVVFGYEFPGNIRELRNLVERAIVLGDGHTVRLDPFRVIKSPYDVVSREAAMMKDKVLSHLRVYLGAAEFAATEVIVRALVDTRGNISETAQRAGYGRGALRKKLSRWRDYGLDPNVVVKSARALGKK